MDFVRINYEELALQCYVWRSRRHSGGRIWYLVSGGTRSLFNYLVPMVQNKQAEEEIERGATGRAK
jgi:hypothetical protein